MLDATCDRCGVVQDIVPVEGTPIRRSLPKDWWQVQMTPEVGRVQNRVLCSKCVREPLLCN